MTPVTMPTRPPREIRPPPIAPPRSGSTAQHTAMSTAAPPTSRSVAIVDVAQRAGLSLEEIRELTGPDSRGEDASRQIRELADRKLRAIDALIERAQAVRRWLEVARTCDCSSVDVCGLFTDPTLAPPAANVQLDIRIVGSPKA